MYSTIMCSSRRRRAASARDAAPAGSSLGRLRLRCLRRRVAAAQVLDQVGHVSDLLLEIALVRLEPREQLVAVREGAVEVQPPLTMPVSVHQFTSFPRS